MKKRIAILLFALIALLSVFAACSKTPTTKSVRWEDNESYTFNISLADFNVDGGTLFKSHDYSIKKDDGTDTIVKCYKDAGAIVTDNDEICPAAAKGTFTMSISFDTTTSRKLETTQVIYSQYAKETLQSLGCLDKFEGGEYDVTAKEENPFENNEGRITLRNQTTSTVLFTNDANQLPISSVKENTGYYIGRREYQGPSNYKYETTYDFDNRKITVKNKDGEEEVIKLKKGATCIDSSQVLLYLRSIDKSASAFSDSPSVSVFDPVVNKSALTATFALEREFYAYLNNNGTYLGASVQAVAVTIGGRAFLTEFNLPDLTAAGEGGKGLDFLPATGAGKTCKYTTIKFRSGWYSYELSEYNAEVLSAIDLKNKTAK